MKSLRGKAGFTLIEVCIVLAIIGLLLVGVIKGEQLLKNAKVKKQLKQIEQVKSAVVAYQDMKKGVWPGDAAKDGQVDASPAALDALKAEKLIVGSTGQKITNAFGGTLDIVYDATAVANVIEITAMPDEAMEAIDELSDDGVATTGDILYYAAAAGPPAVVARLIIKL